MMLSSTRTLLPRLASSQLRPLFQYAPRTFASSALLHQSQRTPAPDLKLQLESEYTHTEPAWPHPVYTYEQMEQIVPTSPPSSPCNTDNNTTENLPPRLHKLVGLVRALRRPSPPLGLRLRNGLQTRRRRGIGEERSRCRSTEVLHERR